MTDHSSMRLGKKAVRHDTRTLKFKTYLPAELPAAKPSVDYTIAVSSWPMYGNNSYGDCAIAAIGHMVEAWSANVGDPVVPDTEEILRVYKILSPDDDGCVLLDVLNYWRQNAICGVQLGAYAAVDPSSHTHMMLACEWFGGLYTGAALPIAAQNQGVWDVSDGPNAAAGSWGGHCTNWEKYDNDGDSITWTLITWGTTKDATQAWADEYLDEVYALISPDWFDGDGKTPEGFDMAALQEDLHAVTA